MKTRKRLLLMVLAAVFTGSMGISAFALSNTTTITVKYVEPTIEVTVPTTGEAFIDPYGLPIDVGGGLTVSGQQIASKPMGITNKSDVDLEVSVELTGAVTGDVRLVSEPLASDDTGKKAFVYLQMKTFTEGTDASGANILKNLESLPTTYDAAKSVILLDGRTTRSETSLATLKAKSDPPQPASNAAFRLTGSCVKSPTEKWSVADGFTATVVFTFSPPMN